MKSVALVSATCFALIAFIAMSFNEFEAGHCMIAPFLGFAGLVFLIIFTILQFKQSRILNMELKESREKNLILLKKLHEESKREQR